MKFFAPWCRACKGLEPKFRQISLNPTNADVVFASFNVQNNKEFVKSLGILALPNIHFYANGETVDNFPCGPSKVPMFRKKLDSFVSSRIDPSSGLVISPPSSSAEAPSEAVPCRTRNETVFPPSLAATTRNISYFRDMPEADFDLLLSNFVLSSYDPGSTIMLQGNSSRKFYVVASGEVEVLARTGYEDPLVTPSSYMGAVVNRLDVGNFFGERSLITGEPRAASIVAVDSENGDTTRCFVINQEDIPSSCVLSGSSRGLTSSVRSALISEMDVKYGGLTYLDGVAEDAAGASQTRGSVNNPLPLDSADATGELPAAAAAAAVAPAALPIITNTTSIIPLLVKFKLVRQTARCFEHVMRTSPRFGDDGEIYRRSLFVSQLTASQRSEIEDVFEVLDRSGDGEGDGTISILDLKRFMESIGEDKGDDELGEMINKANPLVDGNTSLNFSEFLGMMAEAEFYYLFLDTFQALDKYNSGFIRAGDLKKVLENLGGVVMGSDEKTSIVKVEDEDLLINYETFSRALVGA
ncbi:hypothetical protein TeGR_g8137 [Tetraparma gracilis]|nr:hypothetical protein TeGR_g8137 [Tetraparma gracilis]